MPKKFQGENSKSAVARARKEATKQAEDERKAKEVEDALWAEDDKHVLRKQQRKIDKDAKRLEQAQKKLESKQLLDEEMNSIRSVIKEPVVNKLTRAQIQDAAEKRKVTTTGAPTKDVQYEVPLEENINRTMAIDETARSVEEAIAILSVKEVPVDRHPEKRMKAAYALFEEENLPRLKQENPNLRLTQLKQMLKKDWMKSPANPLNQNQL